MKSNSYACVALVVPVMSLWVSVALGAAQDTQADDYVFDPPIGVCTGIENAALVRQHGYAYLEAAVGRLLVPGEPEAGFAPRYEAFQASVLPVSCYNNFLPGSLKSTGPKADHAAVLEYAETAFKRARRCRSRIIVFGSSGSRGIPAGFSRAKATEQFVALLREMGPIAAKFGITVVIEPLNRKECNFVNTVAEATRIAQAVNHPNIRVLADFYHMLLEKEGPGAIVKAGPLLAHCHIAEAKDRRAPGTYGEDFTGYFRALKEIRYRGGISIECRWQDLDGDLPVARAYLRAQVQAARTPASEPSGTRLSPK